MSKNDKPKKSLTCTQVLDIYIYKKSRNKTNISTSTSFSQAIRSLPSAPPPFTPPGVSCTAVSALMLNTHIKYSTNYSATSPAKVRSRSRSRSAWEAERSRTNTAPRAKERRNGCQVPRGGGATITSSGSCFPLNTLPDLSV